MAKKAKKAPAYPVVTFALLDDFGVLQGYDHARRSMGAPAGSVEVPDDCDLAPGRYRWDQKIGRFHPLPPANSLTPDIAPDALRAIWAGFKALHENGTPLPVQTLDWLAAYGKTIDAKG